LVSSGKHSVRKLKRAQILLAADSGLADDDHLVTEMLCWAAGGPQKFEACRWYLVVRFVDQGCGFRKEAALDSGMMPPTIPR
jgi:hypothetical protein